MYHTTSSAAWYGVQEQYTVLSSSIMHMRILSLGLPCGIEIYFFCRETKKQVTANGWLQGYTREEVGLFLCWKKQGRIKKRKVNEKAEWDERMASRGFFRVTSGRTKKTRRKQSLGQSLINPVHGGCCT